MRRMKKIVWMVLGLALSVLLCGGASASSAFVDDGIYAAYSGIVRKNFTDYSPECSYDEETNLYSVHLVMSGVAETSYPMRSRLEETWTNVREQQRALSETCYTGLKDLGYDVNCMVTVVDNSGTAPVAMIICYNGNVIYDFMAE